MPLVSPINQLASSLFIFSFSHSFIHIREVRFSLQEDFHLPSLSSLLPKPLPVIFGIPDFLDDDDLSSNITRGAIEVLPVLLLQASPSIDLLTALKQPFDDEATSRNPSSWHKAKVGIHHYLMVSRICDTS